MPLATIVVKQSHQMEYILKPKLRKRCTVKKIQEKYQIGKYKLDFYSCSHEFSVRTRINHITLPGPHFLLSQMEMRIISILPTPQATKKQGKQEMCKCPDKEHKITL